MALPSGLPEDISPDEDIARFLTQSGHYNASGPRPSAFLPNPKNRETSVYRHGAEPLGQLKAIAAETVGKERGVHGAGIVKANVIHEVKLELKASEPPLRHADVKAWPWAQAEVICCV